MEIKLKKLTLTNFKGIKSFTLETNGENVNISGQNETGKTTLIDAFLWLLFNKNSEGVTDFNIKTLDENNNPIHKINHEVEAVLDVDLSEVTLKKSYREKWIKKRGEEIPEFSGHETTYFWNEVPINQKDYKEKIDSLCEENIFKMITNPRAFNALRWQDRREILFDIAGRITDQEIAQGKKQFEELLNQLEGKTLEEQRQKIQSQKRNLKSELEEIPTRIDEITRNIPEKPDEKSIREKIKKKESAIKKINDQLEDQYKANEEKNRERIEKQKQIHDLKNRLQQIQFQKKQEQDQEENEHFREKSKLENEIGIRENAIEQYERGANQAQKEIEKLSEDIQLFEEEINRLRNDWEKLNESEIEFDGKDFICPTCKRDLDLEDIDSKKKDLKENFNKSKLHELDLITNKGKFKTDQVQKWNEKIEETRKKIQEYEESISNATKEIIQLKIKLDDLNLQSEKPKIPLDKILLYDGDYQTILKKIEQLEKEPEPQESTNDLNPLREQREQLIEEINGLKIQLSTLDQINHSEARIKELESETKRLGAEIAKLEKVEFTIENFTREKIDRVETKINEKFKSVRWKMFNQLINGGTEETCECLINGVPYQDANNAAKINSGLEIINTLCDHYGVRAPIFIDNAEAVNHLQDINSQLIKLIVSNHKKLTIQPEKKLESLNA